jgi:hypothetical protein
MTEQLIQVSDIAKKTGKHKSAIFKVINKLKISTQKISGDDSRGQLASYVTESDSQSIIEYIGRNGNFVSEEKSEFNENQVGYFYLIQLEPNHDPLRFKVGFAINVGDRLIKHKCSAPYATIIRQWPCKLLWEKTAIDYISIGCERIHTEVFRAPRSLDETIEKCERFFALFQSEKSLSR